MGDLNGGFPFHHIHRKPVGWRPASNAADAANPVAGLIVRKWIQYRNMVIGIGTLLDGVRSFNYGVTFSALVNVTGAGPANAIWRYGNRFFVCGRDIPRLRISKNFGTTWSTNPVALPSATAIPSAICEHQEQRYVFCNDGAINRVYIHKPYMDI
jgi:hypothetical protein